MISARKRNIGLLKVAKCSRPRVAPVGETLARVNVPGDCAVTPNLISIPGRGVVSFDDMDKAESLLVLDDCSKPEFRPQVKDVADSSSGTTASFCPTRSSAPLVAISGKASVSRALQACSSEENKRASILALENDKVANSAKASRESLWNTWCRMHTAWFGLSIPVLPLTTEKIKCVAAMFKAGGYISFINYASRAKSEHISRNLEHHCPWTIELGEEIRSAKRSITRGTGCSRQSMPVDVNRIKALNLPQDFAVDRGPIGPVDFVVGGTFFMTREIEISCAGWCHIFIDKLRSEVTWSLPVSKGDPRAIGTSRTWGCVCDGDLALACPFHSMEAQIRRVAELAGRLGRSPLELPLFPDSDGNEISKTAAVDCINHLVKLTGCPTVCPAGRPLYGGHSLRTGGAVTLSSLGLDLQRIECMARWHSPMILQYARTAPLKSITAEFKLRMKMSLAEHRADDTSDRVSVLQTSMDSLSLKLDSIRATESEWMSRIVGLESANSCSQYVMNTKGLTWHRTHMHNSLCATSLWRTDCGWPYMNCSHRLQVGMPEFDHTSAICGKCLPSEKLMNCM